MSNRITFDALARMEPKALASITAEELAMLQDDLDELKADVKAKAANLNDAMGIKFGSAALLKRQAAGKDTGTVTVTDGEFSVTADIPKKVEWDQPLLAKAVSTVHGWGENPADYVSIKYDVAEAKYGAWPPAIRKEFEPARTVKPGNQTFKIKRGK